MLQKTIDEFSLFVHLAGDVLWSLQEELSLCQDDDLKCEKRGGILATSRAQSDVPQANRGIWRGG